MRVTIRFHDSREPQKVEAVSAPEALRQVNDSDAYVIAPWPAAYECIAYSPAQDQFRFGTGRTAAQAVESVFEGGGA